jgi:hypothetical protein
MSLLKEREKFILSFYSIQVSGLVTTHCFTESSNSHVNVSYILIDTPQNVL